MKQYIVTSAQKGATPNWKFLRNLEVLAKEVKAEILILELSGCYKQDTEIAPELKEKYTVVTSKMKLNSNIVISPMPIPPQSVDPVTGIGRLVQDDCSTIIASPKIRMKPIPNSNVDLPKIAMSTGVCTLPYYKEHTRTGRIAKDDHSYGAIIVEILDKTFYQYRQIPACRNGSFYDLGKHYYNKKSKHRRPEALVLGDWHSGSTSPDVANETYRMLRDLNPKRVFLHDLFDAKSISHHEDGKIISKVKTLNTHGLSLEDELYNCACEIYTFSEEFPDTEFIVVKSNHDTHLDRYLNEARFIKEPQNAYIGAKLLVKVLDGNDALVSGLSEYMDIPKNFKFLSRDSDYRVYGFQCAAHGDITFNGARGGNAAIEAATGKCVIAHRHSPEIFRNVYVVGTSTYLKLDYNQGMSSWMNTHCLIYDNGTAQLVNIVNGKYRF